MCLLSLSHSCRRPCPCSGRHWRKTKGNGVSRRVSRCGPIKHEPCRRPCLLTHGVALQVLVLEINRRRLSFWRRSEDSSSYQKYTSLGSDLLGVPVPPRSQGEVIWAAGARGKDGPRPTTIGAPKHHCAPSIWADMRRAPMLFESSLLWGPIYDPHMAGDRRLAGVACDIGQIWTDCDQQWH